VSLFFLGGSGDGGPGGCFFLSRSWGQKFPPYFPPVKIKKTWTAPLRNYFFRSHPQTVKKKMRGEKWRRGEIRGESVFSGNKKGG
jgi:hypothetical protein